MAEVEFGGVKFTGGKMFALITALSTLGGSAWGAFEFYNDYRNMKSQIQSYVAPDLSGFQEQLSVIEAEMQAVRDEVKLMDQNMNETADRVSDIKNDLRDDIVRVEKIVDQVEDKVNDVESSVRTDIQRAEERFENRRDQLLNDYDEKANRLRDTTDQKIKDLEDRLNKKLQRALDNPLAN